MFKVYKKLFLYIPKERHIAILVICASFFSSFLIVGGYYYLYKFFHTFLVEGSIDSSTKYVLPIGLLLIIGNSIYFGSVLLSHFLGFRLETNFRKRGIDGLKNSSFRFFDMNDSGYIRKVIDDNSEMTHMIVAHLIPDNSSAFITPILLIILSFICGKYTGISIAILLIPTFITLYFMMGDKNFMDIYQKSLDKMSSEAVEYVRGISIIKIFRVDIDSFRTLKKSILDYSKYAYYYSKSCKKPYVLFQLFLYGFSCFMVLGIIILNKIGVINLNKSSIISSEIALQILMGLMLSGMIFITIMKIMYLSMYNYQANMVVDKLEELYNNMGKDSVLYGKIDKMENFDIEFEDVEFSYGDKKVLSNFNLRLAPNKTYALVGSSGGGKSTIAKLLSGFYKVDSGSIKIGGHNIYEYTENVIKDNISFVFQDTKLFKMSIYDNVKIGNKKAMYDEVMKALYDSGCEGILNKFKDRENTIVGSNGVYLSGGEKQRIAIARAILKNSNIIILDEASASIDADNEYELLKAFSNLIKNKTVIMIAHRMSSIKNVDEILVLENGKIVERGNDKELSSIDSRYKYLKELYFETNSWTI